MYLENRYVDKKTDEMLLSDSNKDYVYLITDDKKINDLTTLSTIKNYNTDFNKNISNKL